MSDPEMRVSGWDFSGLSGVLDDKKIRIEKKCRKRIGKASLYSHVLTGAQTSGLCSIAP